MGDQKADNGFKAKKRNNKKSSIIIFIILIVIIIGGWWLYPSVVLFSDKDFKKYCKKDDLRNSYSCNLETSWKEEDIALMKKLVEICSKAGYKNTLSPQAGYNIAHSFDCYVTDDVGRQCRDNKECASYWCVPDNVDCQNNCTGKCSTHRAVESEFTADHWYFLVEGRVIKDINELKGSVW